MQKLHTQGLAWSCLVSCLRCGSPRPQCRTHGVSRVPCRRCLPAAPDASPHLELAASDQTLGPCRPGQRVRPVTCAGFHTRHHGSKGAPRFIPPRTRLRTAPREAEATAGQREAESRCPSPPLHLGAWGSSSPSESKTVSSQHLPPGTLQRRLAVRAQGGAYPGGRHPGHLPNPRGHGAATPWRAPAQGTGDATGSAPADGAGLPRTPPDNRTGPHAHPTSLPASPACLTRPVPS